MEIDVIDGVLMGDEGTITVEFEFRDDTSDESASASAMFNVTASADISVQL